MENLNISNNLPKDKDFFSKIVFENINNIIIEVDEN
jgi:hypothetical protein